MPRDMLCYCLQLTYEHIRHQWRTGQFNGSAHQAGDFCTNCKGDLEWFLATLEQEKAARSADGDAGFLEHRLSEIPSATLMEGRDKTS